MIKTDKNERYRDKYLNQILEIKPDFQRYYKLELKQMATQTQLNNLRVLFRFFSKIKFFSQEEIENYISSDYWIGLRNDTKNVWGNMIKKWLIFEKFDNLAKCIKRYKKEHRELNKNELITRSELKKVLKVCNAKKRAMIMVNYECALRRKELVNIRYRDIQHDDEKGEFNLYISQSKTIKRNMPLDESIPFLREHFSMNDFKPDDLIFPYVPEFLSTMYNRIAKRAGLKKRFYPHILRHSRLTELALTKLNEPQLRKFAGWSRSSAMAEVYFHIDDSDIREILFGTSKKEIKIVSLDNPMENLLRVREDTIKELKNHIGVLEKMLRKFDVPKMIKQQEYMEAILSKISEEDIIEILGMKESPKKSGEKLKISPEVKKKSK